MGHISRDPLLRERFSLEENDDWGFVCVCVSLFLSLSEGEDGAERGKEVRLVEIRYKPGLDHELELRCVLAAKGEETDRVGFSHQRCRCCCHRRRHRHRTTTNCLLLFIPSPLHSLSTLSPPPTSSSRTTDVIRSRAPHSGRGRLPIQKELNKRDSTPFNFFCTSIHNNHHHCISQQ